MLVPGFSLVALSCAVDVLRAAHLEMPEEGFEWRFVSADGAGRVRSSAGIELDVGSLASAPGADAVAVCGGDRTHAFRDGRSEAHLRRQAADGLAIGAISDGAFLVARAGLFRRSRSTIHWKCQTAYREAFPELDIRASLLEIDGARFSCAGGTASLDLMLHFVRQRLGDVAAARIADNYVHDRLRGDDEAQPLAAGLRLTRLDPMLAAAVRIMQRSLEAPTALDAVADELSITPRRLNRLFHRHLGRAPSQHYRLLRLERAAGLLRQSGLSVGEIALACGFQSASHMARHFGPAYGTTPSAFRNGERAASAVRSTDGSR